MAAPKPTYLKLEDLSLLAGADTITRLFDDTLSGSADDDTAAVIMANAEGTAKGYLLRAYNDNQMRDLGRNDPTFKMHVAWVAIEMASERRSEFVSEDGKGRYWQQYLRAITFFENLSKAKIRTPAESVIGPGANVGGATQPSKASLRGRKRFVFATDRDNPGGSGGF